MHIQRVTEITDEMVISVQDLARLLGEHKPVPSIDDLKKLVKSENSILIVARHPDENSPIAGMLTLTIYRVPTGGRSIVEDLVVAGEHRNMGIAKALLLKSMELARSAGADGIALTSNPGRREANQLYLRMGFIKRETNAYFFELK
jgi:ribosomal protein S18 acetylase RimI-like enzyme